MNRIFATTLIISSLFAFSVSVFAQVDPNPFTNTNINQENNPNTNANTNQEQNINSDVNTNTEANTNSDVSVSSDPNVSGDANVNGDSNVNGDVYSNTDTNQNTDYNLSGWYINQDATIFNGQWNPFWGATHNTYNPWEQPTFNQNWQSFSGDINQNSQDQTNQYKYTGEGVYGKFKQKEYEGVYSKGTETNIFSAGQNLFDSNTSQGTKTLSCSRDIKQFADVFLYAACFVNSFIIQLVLTVAFIYFAWGILKYVNSTANAEERTQARQTIMYGIIAMFVMVCVWGIIALFKTTLGI